MCTIDARGVAGCTVVIGRVSATTHYAIAVSPIVRRSRGVLLRLVRRRAFSVVAGLLLVAPALLIQIRGASAWWMEGLSLLLGATGVALLWTGLFGIRPDWID